MKVKNRDTGVAVRDAAMLAQQNAIPAILSIFFAAITCWISASLYPVLTLSRFPIETLPMISAYVAYVTAAVATFANIILRSRFGTTIPVRQVVGCTVQFFATLLLITSITPFLFHVPKDWTPVVGKILRVDYVKNAPISFYEYGTKLHVSYPVKGEEKVAEVYTTEGITPPGGAPANWQERRYLDDTEKHKGMRHKWLSKVNQSFLTQTIYTEDTDVELIMDPKNSGNVMIANWVPRIDPMTTALETFTLITAFIVATTSLFSYNTAQVRMGIG